MASNKAAITVYGDQTAPLMGGNLSMSLAFVGLNESAIMSVVVGSATSTLANTTILVASTPLNGTVGYGLVLNQTVEGVSGGGNATSLRYQELNNGTEARKNLTATLSPLRMIRQLIRLSPLAISPLWLSSRAATRRPQRKMHRFCCCQWISIRRLFRMIRWFE